MAEKIDLLAKGWYLVTMNEGRDIIRNGAVAVRDGKIVAVGKADDLEVVYAPEETIGGERFVITPGLVNAHIHITGEPLTRGYVPDDTPFEENVFVWLCGLYSVHYRGGRATLSDIGLGGDAQVWNHNVSGSRDGSFSR